MGRPDMSWIGTKYSMRWYVSDRPVELDRGYSPNNKIRYKITGGLKLPTDRTPRVKVKGLENILREHVAN